MAASRSAASASPALPLELLDDTAARGIRLDQLRELVRLWVSERPTRPLPKTVGELAEVLVA